MNINISLSAGADTHWPHVKGFFLSLMDENMEQGEYTFNLNAAGDVDENTAGIFFLPRFASMQDGLRNLRTALDGVTQAEMLEKVEQMCHFHFPSAAITVTP